jgi:starch synthase (maltosyl-transferring)
MVVNMDPYQPHDATVRVPPELYGGSEHDGYSVVDLLTGERYSWFGSYNYVLLEPHKMPAHILHVERLAVHATLVGA